MKKFTDILPFASVLAVLAAVAAPTYASEMRYAPVNPGFGGNPFNGTYLLGTADGQNDNVKPTKPRNSIEDFSRSITSSLLSRISSEITDRILGENAQDSGHFTIGDLQLDFVRNGDIVTIDINDNATGQQTTIEVPAPAL